jgi:hypothetical protein
MPSLAEAIEYLSSVVESDSPNFDAGQYVEIRRNQSEVILGGNRNGLVWIALHCLALAEQGQSGSHLHLDKHSTEVCECPLVIRYWTQTDASSSRMPDTHN